jgi:hypothetical protein
VTAGRAGQARQLSRNHHAAQPGRKGIGDGQEQRRNTPGTVHGAAIHAVHQSRKACQALSRLARSSTGSMSCGLAARFNPKILMLSCKSLSRIVFSGFLSKFPGVV